MTPMTGWSARGIYDDKLIWSGERVHPASDPRGVYFVAGPFPVKED